MVRLRSWLLLCSLATLLASPLLLALSEPGERHPQASHHTDGKPCPAGDDHDPCAGGCLGLCCPAHLKALSSPQVATVSEPPQLQRHHSGASSDDHPEGVSVRIFRPPRA